MRRLIGRPQPHRNSILPLEILFIVFSFYTEHETPTYPLETLLLVCRFWRDAALRHRNIWSTFKIMITSPTSAVRWIDKISRRLKLSGPNSPIYFELRISRDAKPVTSDFNKLISSISGVDGALCARWKEFELEPPFLSDYDIIMDYFSYPTPILSSLKLHSFYLTSSCVLPVGYRFLPSAPSLQTVVLSRCRGFPIPDISNARYVEIYRASTYNDFPGGLLDLKALGPADRLQYLSLGYCDFNEPNNMPQTLPSLVSLHLGIKIPTNINEVRLPLLQLLSLDYHPDNITTLLACPGIPFKELKSLRFAHHEDFPHPKGDELTTPCRALFKECQQMENLTLDKEMFKQIVRQVRKGKVEGDIFFNESFDIRISTQNNYNPFEKPDWHSGPIAFWAGDDDLGMELILEDDDDRNVDHLYKELIADLDGDGGPYGLGRDYDDDDDDNGGYDWEEEDGEGREDEGEHEGGGCYSIYDSFW